MLLPTPCAWLVTVNVYAPGAALAPTFTVSVAALVVTLAGATLAVTPFGIPLTASETAPGKFVRVIWMADVPLVPGASVRLTGFSASEIADPACTEIASEAVAEVTPWPVPRTIALYVPAVVVGAAVSVSVLVVDPGATDAGANVPVIPAGAPSNVRATAPSYPPFRATVTAVVAVWPTVMFTVGDAMVTPIAPEGVGSSGDPLEQPVTELPTSIIRALAA